MQDALQIAQAYLADKGGAFGISGVSDRVPEGSCRTSPRTANRKAC